MDDNKRIVYIVTGGTYEDYHICGVYDSLDLAEKARIFYTNPLHCEIAEIEEWIINKMADNPGPEND
jgi:hypothetical protein